MSVNVLESMNPSEYFDFVKDKRNKITDEDLSRIYDNCLELLNKAIITGQTKAARKLVFHLDCLEKERDIIKRGIDTFVYEDDITNYIETVAKDVVKIIELKDYEREIPSDIVAAYSEVKDLFSKSYVVFTDYTGKVERQIAKERQEKDPILFGSFQDPLSGTLIERFYFIGDWEDEYCDLTLDKMVNETREHSGSEIMHNISLPRSLEELKVQLNHLESADGSFRVVSKPVRNNILTRVRSFLKL